MILQIILSKFVYWNYKAEEEASHKLYLKTFDSVDEADVADGMFEIRMLEIKMIFTKVNLFFSGCCTAIILTMDAINILH